MEASEIDRLHKQEWEEAAEEYGDAFRVPSDVAWRIDERTRCRHVLALHIEDRGEIAKYGIAGSILAEIAGDLGVSEKRVTIADKYKTLKTWLKDNVGAQVTAEQIAEVGGFSLSTASNYIRDNVATFAKVKRGLYEVRDAAAERAAAKV